MDLRIVKTRKNIREAFFELRSKYALEKIKIKRLCEVALVNKTTFYKHYQDVYALSDEIENELIKSIMNGFEHMNSLFTDPDEFMRGLYKAFMSHENEIKALFSGRMNILIDKVEKQLIAHYPTLSSDPEREIMTAFLLKGSASVLMEPKYEETVMLDALIKAARQIFAVIDSEK